ncbi:VOC family protein [Candidatus Symbiopectobacterium sp. NZEC135]|uniref:VOC family protein n=1 Tax=Candidatus Symbiopectobacterium sp. NZEC135 TaxID=2820471 RepID=UPI002225CC12|nr:VOC family protein [Candidatus Symbiopectobacterium sp. NZEC135]MCW2478540.1 VOC family protein [Candidatus Symbiopectobacterium sp. NZEC135]
MATLRWDHAVHYVNHLDDAVTTFTDNQLVAFPGGAHPGWGTHNALSYFGLTYLEFLSIRDAHELEQAQDFLLSQDAKRLLPEQQVLYRVALRSDDIDATHQALRDQGLALSPIVEGKRHDKQGNLIEWRIFTISGDFQGVPYPFVLQWKTNDAARLDFLRTHNIDRPHPVGQARLQAAVFTVQHPEQVARHWQKLFSFSASEHTPTTLYIGEQQFIFQPGEENRLTALHIATDNNAVKGTSVILGGGEYQFV